MSITNTADWFSLDIETEPVDPRDAKFAALEPFRLRQGRARIGSVAVRSPDSRTHQITRDEMDQLPELLHMLSGKVVWAHNAVFDTAWLIAQLQPNKHGPIPSIMKDIRWMDTRLLGRWLLNSQWAETTGFFYTLVNLVKHFIPDHPLTNDFVAMKDSSNEAGDDDDYWLHRGEMDVILTLDLAKAMWAKLPNSQKIGFIMEQGNIVPAANAWIMGIDANENRIDELEPKIISAKKKISQHISIPESIIDSATKLGNLLYIDLGLSPHKSSEKTGKGSTDKESLVYLRKNCYDAGDKKNGDLLGFILQYKSLRTTETKYINGLRDTNAHVGSYSMHAAPRIFGTYTGRFTYSNCTGRKRKEFKTSLALHQVPRLGPVRGILVPPPGYLVAEFDAAGQESRIMAIRSGDPTMIQIFRDGKNFHSMTGSRVIGMEYDTFMDKYKEGDAAINEYRQNGKFINLSCNYRIGDGALQRKAFIDYDIVVDFQTARFWNTTFKTTYKGVPEYWKDVISESRMKGYVDEYGGRRMYLTDWSEARWQTESTAVNFPIQGGGASMKNIAITMLAKKHPEFLFALDLHDGLYGFLPIEGAEQSAREIRHSLDNIDYEKFWGFRPAITLSWDAAIGPDFKQLKEIK